MDFFDGLDALFLGTFGEKENALVTPKGGTVARPVRVIWNPAHVEVSVGNQGVRVETTSAAADISARDAEGIGQGARLSYGGKHYEVEIARPDLVGQMVTLVLKRAAAPRP